MADEKHAERKPAAVNPVNEPAAKAENKERHGSGLVAAVLIRGLIGIRKDIKDTLFMLRLKKKHACVVLADDAITRGMLAKCKDFIAYGPVAKETADALAKQRKPRDTKRPVYHLAPPRGGFERGGIKKSFTQGGVLGRRKEMDSLLKRMM